MQNFASSLEAVRALTPDYPVTFFRPHAASRAARWFLDNFPGDVLYAIKTNPDPVVLDAVHGAGVRRFEAASLAEIALVRGRFGDVRVSYMNTVKSRESIARAYRDFGVRDFAVDTHDELNKVLAATDNAADLTIMVRIGVSNHHAEIDLSRKFGVGWDEAPGLLLAARRAAERLGVCFHVGSQCMEPLAFRAALEQVNRLVVQAGVFVDVVDVGGGFPAAYPDLTPPPLSAYMDEIKAAVAILPVAENCALWCEPGRALAADAASTLARVELRKGNMLYINDGTYGSLFDAGFPGLVYPTTAIRVAGEMSGELAAFGLFGPTCDGLDHMKGPFILPADIGEGDYIEIAKTGAYGTTMRTQFNGFYWEHGVLIEDEPIMSLFAPATRNAAEEAAR